MRYKNVVIASLQPPPPEKIKQYINDYQYIFVLYKFVTKESFFDKIV